MLLGYITEMKMLTFSLLLLLLIQNAFGETEQQPTRFVCPDGWLDETLYDLGWKRPLIDKEKVGY